MKGNVYLTGVFSDSATFYSTNGATKAVSGAGQVAFFAKYNSRGNLLRVQTGFNPGGGGTNFGASVAVNEATGSVYLTGNAQGDFTFSSSNGHGQTIPGVDTWHVIIAKYDENGIVKWAQTSAGSPNCMPYGVAVDHEDNAYVTGWLMDQTTFYSADGRNISVTGFSPGDTTPDLPADGFIAKYDRNGNAKWVNHIGGYKAIANSVTVSQDGKITSLLWQKTATIGGMGAGTADSRTIDQ